MLTPAMLPFCESSDQNKGPILAALREVLADRTAVLEIGSGTGQHAVHFARELPHLVWQPSDLPDMQAGILAWLEAEGPANCRPPLVIDVCAQPWPVAPVDAVFSANTAHIMAWPAVEAMFRGVGQVLPPAGVFCLYGPFSRGGRTTSAGDAAFDRWLRGRDPAMGLRDIDELTRLARANALEPYRDFPMPVNNRTLVWRKTGAAADLAASGAPAS